MNSVPTLYIMLGYPGAGKTTTAQYIAELTGAVHIWTDYERIKMFGNYTRSGPESKQLYGELNQRAATLLKEGKSVVFDTNFRYRKDRDLMRQIAAAANATTKVIWLATNRQLAEERATSLPDGAKNRIFGNISIHDFEQVAGYMDEPGSNEQSVILNGVNLTKTDVARALGMA